MHIGTYEIIPSRSTIMGIVNITPDSFYDGGAFEAPERAIAHALKLCDEGADIIDIGGESSRPGAAPVSVEEEQGRVLPVIEGIRRCATIPLSIDTCKAVVAKRALDAGATMINDISAGRRDPELLSVVALASVPICLMHMRGNPQTMQQDMAYDDLLGEVALFFEERLGQAMAAGIEREQIILDPGIGFGKSPQGNIDLLHGLEHFLFLQRPLLIGSSRKSFIGKLLNHRPEDRLEATLATLSFARRKGAQIFRVHDVAAARRYLDMVDLLERPMREGGREGTRPMWPVPEHCV